jgi:ribosomal protein S18 acetylase RimI-like enzyme
MSLDKMPFHIRHFEKKLILYGLLLAIFIVFSLCMVYYGIGIEMILLTAAVIFIIYVIAYLLFDSIAMRLSNAKLIRKADEPRVFNIVDKLSKEMGMRAPKISMVNRSVADAYIMGRDRSYTLLMITPSLLIEYSDAELEAIIKNEMQATEEFGFFIYNLVTMSMAALAEEVGHIRSRSLLNELSFTGNGNEHDRISRPKISETRFIVKLLIANDMYNCFNLHTINRMVRDASPLLLTAYRDDRPVGFTIGEIYRSRGMASGRLCKFIVEDSYRGKGIGNQLMQCFMSTITRMGCRSCSIEVRIDNKNAIALYEKFEFKKDTIVAGYYPDGTDGLIMIKQLVL